MYKQSQLAVILSALLPLSGFVHAETFSFDEVVVSATRTEQSKQDVSSSIETVSAEELSTNIATDLKDALKYTPGVEAKDSGRFGLSGLNIRGVEDSRIKLMVDGVQQPVPYNPGSSEQRKYPSTIEIDTLQTIEINKGPSSTLYGSDALGGAVLLRTKNPEDILQTEGDESRFGLKSSYTSASEQFKNTLTWAMRRGDLETLVMATYANGHETKTHSSGSTEEGPSRGAANPADTELGNLLTKAFYQVNDNHRFGVTLEYYEQQYDEDELNYNNYTLFPGFVYTDNFNKDTNQRLRVGFEHQAELDGWLAESFNWSLSYQDSSALSKNYDTTPSNGRRLRERDASDQTIQLDSQFSKVVLMGENAHEFTYGATYLVNDFQLDNLDYKFDFGTVTPGSTGIPDATVTQWGLFLQDQAYLMQDRLIINAGLRYDSFVADPSTDTGYSTNYPKNQDSALTGKIGSVYHLNDKLSVFGQISQGFKAPTVYDLYYFYNQGAIIEANPDLKAERSIAYELGLRAKNDHASVELTAFYNDYSDFITQEKTGESGGKDVITKKNLDEVRIYGAEFSTKIALDRAFDAPSGTYTQVAVTYMDGEDQKTGQSLDSVSPLVGIVGLGLTQDTYGSQLSAKMVAGKHDWQSADNVDAAGYTVVDLTAHYQPMSDLTISAGVFNLFDKKYWLYNDLSGRTSSNAFNIDSKSQPGRNWGVSIEYQF